jgi:formylglycine-generating enzyme required for sulfatase activity
MEVPMGKVRLSFALAVLWVLAIPAGGEDKAVVVEEAEGRLPNTSGNWAVVVGVDRFEDGNVIPLEYAVADAEAVYDELTKPDGLVPPSQAYLHISGGKNPPTKLRILKSIDYMSKHASEPEGMILVYISTHGFVDSQKRPYILPEDGAQTLLEDSAISLARVEEMLGQCVANKKVVVVDACRSKPLRSQRGQPEEVSTLFNQELAQAQGQVTLMACSEGQVSYEDSSLGHGVFTHYFLEGLRGGAARSPQGFVTINTLNDYLCSEIVRWCKENQREPIQRPRCNILESYQSIPLSCPLMGNVPAPVSPTLPPSEQWSKEPARDGTTIRVWTGKERPANPRKKDVWRYPLGKSGVAMDLVWIPPGTFQMGSPEKEKGRDGDEKRHEVEITKGFWLGRFEVTNEQFEAFVKAKGYQTTAEKEGDATGYDGSRWTWIAGLNWRSPIEVGKGFLGPDHPVVQVSWGDCREFLDWAGLDFPTEAQWEYACRAGTQTRRYWGEDLEDEEACHLANAADLAAKRLHPEWITFSCDDGFDETAPVGSFPPNSFGLYDMLGNVYEWCLDEYGKGYYGETPKRDPVCLKGDRDDYTVGGRKYYDAPRVSRGGCWVNDPNKLRCADRYGDIPALRYDSLGLRACKP